LASKASKQDTKPVHLYHLRKHEIIALVFFDGPCVILHHKNFIEAFLCHPIYVSSCPVKTEFWAPRVGVLFLIASIECSFTHRIVQGYRTLFHQPRCCFRQLCAQVASLAPIIILHFSQGAQWVSACWEGSCCLFGCLTTLATIIIACFNLRTWGRLSVVPCKGFTFKAAANKGIR